MRLERPGSFIISLLLGLALGVAFGDALFPGLEEIIGEPAHDIVMGLGGAILAGIIHELATGALRRR